MDLQALRSSRIAVPGLTTTAWMTLQLVLGPDATATPVVTPIVPYERIFDALERDEVDAGLIIHEGRLTYEDRGLHRVVDLGVWWAQSTRGLPLPLGANAIRRDLPPAHLERISALLRASIAYALDHRDEAIAWLLARGGALDTTERLDRYLSMYANQRTLDYGDPGRAGIRTFFERLVQAGLLEAVPALDYAP
jgi:1,4-dihydroxy-6-naphthoate synthase